MAFGTGSRKAQLLEYGIIIPLRKQQAGKAVEDTT
jgi:hypothetical protein